MEDRIFHYKISPEVIKNDLFLTNYTGDSDSYNTEYVVCCDIYTSAVTRYYTGTTYVYSSMTEILSGGTMGTSLLTDLSIPIFLDQYATDIGYYSVFDGMVCQKDTMTNFIFSSTTLNPYQFFFYNTSDVEFKKYLSFSEYKVDWGDGSPIESVTNVSPNGNLHTYTQTGDFTITFSGMSPWGTNVVKKQVTVPYSDVIIDNPYGIAYFVPAGGSWSGTLFNYEYIFTGDSENKVDVQTSDNYTTIPFVVTGYTKSTMNDLEVYGSKSDPSLYDGRFRIGQQITGYSDSVGTFWGPSNDGLYTAYTINNIDYYDYVDGTTIFSVKSSGITSDMIIASAITKNEVLLNVIDEAEVQSNVFIERGKQSGLETIQRLGEVDNVGDLEKYGYKFFNITQI